MRHPWVLILRRVHPREFRAEYAEGMTLEACEWLRWETQKKTDDGKINPISCTHQVNVSFP